MASLFAVGNILFGHFEERDGEVAPRAEVLPFHRDGCV
jgi:hypothetical protein